jgi:predicted transcriptional regulator
MPATKASTHRLDLETRAALDRLSRLLHRPKNRLINEAVKLYVQQKSRKVEENLEATLKELRAYRQRDPDFEKSIDAFVDAVARLGSDDFHF